MCDAAILGRKKSRQPHVRGRWNNDCNKQLQLAIVKTNNSNSCSTHVVQDVATICQTKQSKVNAFPYWVPSLWTHTLLIKISIRRFVKVKAVNWSKVTLDKQIFAQLITEFPAFTKSATVIPRCSQQPATDLYPGTRQSNWHIHIYILRNILIWSQDLRLEPQTGLLISHLSIKISYTARFP